MLASFRLAFVLLVLQAPLVIGDTAPEPVNAVFATSSGVVSWLPPDMPPDDLAETWYQVYGKNEGDEPVLLEEIAPLNFTAKVEGGYGSYGVRVFLRGQASAYCWNVDISPPPPPRITCS